MHESFRRRYFLVKEEVANQTIISTMPKEGLIKQKLKDNILKRYIRKYGIVILDIVFPLGFALFTLYQIYF